MSHNIGTIIEILKKIKDEKDLRNLKERVKKLENQNKPKSWVEEEMDKEIREFLKD